MNFTTGDRIGVTMHKYIVWSADLNLLHIQVAYDRKEGVFTYYRNGNQAGSFDLNVPTVPIDLNLNLYSDTINISLKGFWWRVSYPLGMRVQLPYGCVQPDTSFWLGEQTRQEEKNFRRRRRHVLSTNASISCLCWRLWLLRFLMIQESPSYLNRIRQFYCCWE